MSLNQKIPVTLTEENWKAIIGLIRNSCESKGLDWINWATSINQHIEISIEVAIKLAQIEALGEYEVPLYAGGTISLSDWPYREPIFRRAESGILMTALYLDRFGPDTLATRLAAAKAIRSEAGVTVEL